MKSAVVVVVEDETEYLHSHFLVPLTLLLDKETLLTKAYDASEELVPETLAQAPPRLTREAKDGIVPTRTSIDGISKKTENE
jgi:hypothetical protein